MAEALNRWPGVRRKPKRQTIIGEIIQHRMLYLFTVPGLIWVIAWKWSLIPYLYLAFVKFRPMSGIWNSPFVGFDNFSNVLSNPLLVNLLSNAIIINLMKIAVGTLCSILMALCLNEVKNTGYKRVIQTVTYLPHFVTWVIVGGLLYSFLSFDSGILNQLLTKVLHQPAVHWYNEDYPWRYILVLTSLWKEIGYSTIIYLAILAGINTEIYEACYVDGATKLQQIRFISLPLMVPIIMFVLVMQVAAIIGSDVGQWFALLGSTVHTNVDTIDYVVFRSIAVAPSLGLSTGGFLTLGFGYLTALSMLQGVFAVILLFAGNSVAKRVSNWTGFF